MSCCMYHSTGGSSKNSCGGDCACVDNMEQANTYYSSVAADAVYWRLYRKRHLSEGNMLSLVLGRRMYAEAIALLKSGRA